MHLATMFRDWLYYRVFPFRPDSTKTTLRELHDYLTSQRMHYHLIDMIDAMEELIKKGEPTLTDRNRESSWPNTVPHACAAADGLMMLASKDKSLRSVFSAGASILFHYIEQEVLKVYRDAYYLHPDSFNMMDLREEARDTFHHLLWRGNACDLDSGLYHWFTVGLDSAQAAWYQASREFERVNTTATKRKIRNRLNRTEKNRIRKEQKRTGEIQPLEYFKESPYLIFSTENPVNYRFAQYCIYQGHSRKRRCQVIVVTPTLNEREFKIVSSAIHLKKLSRHIPKLMLLGDCVGIALDTTREDLVMRIEAGIENTSPSETEERISNKINEVTTETTSNKFSNTPFANLKL